MFQCHIPNTPHSLRAVWCHHLFEIRQEGLIHWKQIVDIPEQDSRLASGKNRGILAPCEVPKGVCVFYFQSLYALNVLPLAGEKFIGGKEKRRRVGQRSLAACGTILREMKSGPYNPRIMPTLPKFRSFNLHSWGKAIMGHSGSILLTESALTCSADEDSRRFSASEPRTSPSDSTSSSISVQGTSW